jgi:hypothetical protein
VDSRATTGFPAEIADRTSGLILTKELIPRFHFREGTIPRRSSIMGRHLKKFRNQSQVMIIRDLGMEFDSL